jgi:hypothetical protein
MTARATLPGWRELRWGAADAASLLAERRPERPNSRVLPVAREPVSRARIPRPAGEAERYASGLSPGGSVGSPPCSCFRLYRYVYRPATGQNCRHAARMGLEPRGVRLGRHPEVSGSPLGGSAQVGRAGRDQGPAPGPALIPRAGRSGPDGVLPGRRGQVAVQGGFGDVGLGADPAIALALPAQPPGVLDRVAGLRAVEQPGQPVADLRRCSARCRPLRPGPRRPGRYRPRPPP